MLSRPQRLKTKEFAEAFAKGKTARHPLLSVRVWRRFTAESSGTQLKPVENGPRAAFVVPKKQAKAAKRNRLRRRMRECYRRHPALARWKSALQECDLIFVATPAAHEADFEELNATFTQLLQRAARLASEKPPEKPHGE
ncbi:MAG TPA: ribonuclease P protein component [Abditibacteriaceae bacterium]|jgi:ribonuclease P protein component